MKKIFLSILLILSISVSYAQIKKVIYFDKDWKEIATNELAEYYRVAYVDDSGTPVGKVKDYFITGELQWEGYFRSKDLSCPNAEKCKFYSTSTWYYKTGGKSSEGYYSNGELLGEEKKWDEKGNLRDLKKEALELITSRKFLEAAIKSKIKENLYDPLQGIWKVKTEIQVFFNKELVESTVSYKEQAIIKLDNEYQVFDIDDGKTNLQFTPTSNNGQFRVSTKLGSYTSYGNAQLNGPNSMKMVIKLSKSNVKENLPNVDYWLFDIYFENYYTKLYPSTYDIKNIAKELEDEYNNSIKYAPTTGTGFAIGNGYIVTNYHVIEFAKSIRIRGLKGDFINYTTATIVKTDKRSDLAILKLDNNVSIDNVPYTLSTNTSDVGEDIFVLGYPLTSSMGQEVKLTDGIISSQTGFQGSISDYQISAPIQPGNSGGPLFDKSGDLIGIVSAKHVKTENVGYAIKVSYLKNLIDLLPIKENTVNSLRNKSLSEQVKKVRDFIYLIEVNFN